MEEEDQQKQVLYKTFYGFLVGNMIILEEIYLCLTVTQWNGVQMEIIMEMIGNTTWGFVHGKTLKKIAGTVEYFPS